MRKYPFVKQRTSRDCGPACLQMLLQYYGGYLSLEMLTQITKTDYNGTTAYHLIEGAKQCGFQAKGIEIESIQNLPIPCIAHVIIHSFHHYVVIYEKKEQQLLVADPDKGLQWMSECDFETIWDHIIIALEPTKNLVKVDKEKVIDKQFWKSHLKPILSLWVFTIMELVFSFLFYSGFITLLQGVVPYSCFIFFIGKLWCFHQKEHRKYQLSFLIHKDISYDIFSRFLFLPYTYYRGHTTGEIMSKFYNVEDSHEIMVEIIEKIVFIPLLIALFITILIVHWLLGLVILLLMGIFSLFFRYYQKQYRKYIQNMWQIKGKYTSFIGETCQGYETIKGNSVQTIWKRQFHHIYHAYQTVYQQYQKFLNIIKLKIQLFQGIYFFCFMVVAYFLVTKGISFTTIAFSFLLITSILSLLIELGNLFYKRSFYKDIMNSILELPQESISSDVSDYQTPDIKLIDYHSEILKNIHCQFLPGEKCCIIGGSGSGKTTLLRVLKELSMKQNQIQVEPVTVGKYAIRLISQQEILFTNTLHYNLTLGQAIEPRYMDKICDICNIPDFLYKYKAKYNLWLEENGFPLSDGEKKRVILARGLMKPFALLLLDETFSLLDSNSERQILKKLFAFFSDKTIIVVSHRMDNLDLYNHVIELDNGTIKKDIRKETNYVLENLSCVGKNHL